MDVSSSGRTMGTGLQLGRIFRPGVPAGLLADFLFDAPQRGRRCTDPLLSRATRPMETCDVNARILQLSSLLTGLCGAINELRLDLAGQVCRVHSTGEALATALMESVSKLRRQLAGPGVITIRTRYRRHTVLLMLAAKEHGHAVFRFSGRRTPTRLPDDALFSAAHRLAIRSHGRLRQRGSRIVTLRLPTVLKPVVRNRPARAAPSTPAIMETSHEDRQPVTT